MSSVFLSHSHKDKRYARHIARDITKHGHRVWLDEAEMRVGDSLISKIEKAISELDFLVVLLSRNSVNSEWVKREVEIALNLEIKSRRVKVLPLITESCKVPGFLIGKVYADLSDPHRYRQGLAELLKTLEGGKLNKSVGWHHFIIFRRFFRLRKKERKKTNRCWARILAKATAAFFIIYLVTHIVGFVNDSVYSTKLDKIAVEYDSYYKNYFPIIKTWLPSGWPPRDCNALNIYRQVLCTKYNDDGKKKSKDELEKDKYYNIFKGFDGPSFSDLTYDLQYKDKEELIRFREKYAKYFPYQSDLNNAAMCSRVNASELLIKNPMYLYSALFALRYVHFDLIDARIDLLSGRYEEGLKKIYLLLQFIFDLKNISNCLIGEMTFLAALKNIYKDLIVFMLSKDVSYTIDSIEAIKKLSVQLLDQIDIEKACYKEYLWSGKIVSFYDVKQLFFDDANPLTFFVFGRLKAWKYGFSWKKTLYKEIELYKKLFEGIKYIRNYREKSLYLKDYYARIEKRQDLGVGLMPNFYTVSFKYNIARMLIKTFLLIYNINKYGIESNEVLALKGTENIINEFSGEPFNIIKDNDMPAVVLDEKYCLSLRKIDYKNEHKKLLISFKHFDPQSEEEIKSIFYSFELKWRESLD